MCIPIELDVPVLTIDQHEVGTAREIICSCPADDGMNSPAADLGVPSGDLWLRVERAARRDLYVPFGEILETRPDGVSLRVTRDDLARQDWEGLPPGVKLPAGIT